MKSKKYIPNPDEIKKTLDGRKEKYKVEIIRG